MKSFKQFSEALNFKDRVKEVVWHGWKTDAFAPHHADHWNDLDADDHDDFHQHVRDVVKHAEKHKIKNAKKALDHYTDSISPHVEKQLSDFQKKYTH